MNLPAASHAKPLIAAENLHQSPMAARPILDGINLAIRPGRDRHADRPQRFGKTTLCGRCWDWRPAVSGRIVRNTSRIGYVPQSFAVTAACPLTALRFLRLSEREMRSPRARPLARTGVGHAAERQLSSLSGGEMARVALARALLRAPGTSGAR